VGWKPLAGRDRSWNCGGDRYCGDGQGCSGGGNSSGGGRSGAGALVQGSQGRPASCGGWCPSEASRTGGPPLPHYRPRLSQAGNPAGAHGCHRIPHRSSPFPGRDAVAARPAPVTPATARHTAMSARLLPGRQHDAPQCRVTRGNSLHP